jgi:hypothetical protein
MIVTFKTKAYPDIIMFGKVAKRLLSLMGHSGTVPGALRSRDIGAARARLLAGLEEAGDEVIVVETDQPEGEPKLTLSQRAFPLLELLAGAERKGHDVYWE